MLFPEGLLTEIWGRRGRESVVAGSTTTNAISVYRH